MVVAPNDIQHTLNHQYKEAKHHVQVRLANSYGHDSILDIKNRNPGKPILLIDDDGYSSFESYYKTALDDVGFYELYDVWSTSTSGVPSLSDLMDYQLVIWEFGFNYPYDSTRQNVIADYLDNGGNLFIIGQDIGWGLGNIYWYNTYLKARYIADDSNTNYVAGVSGTFMDGANYNLAGGDGANNNWYSDVIEPLGGAYTIVTYSGGSYSGDGAAIAYSGSYKLVYFAFPFESINNRADRADAMQKVVEGFFDIHPVKLIVSPSNGSVVHGVTRVEVRLTGAPNVDSVFIKIDGGSWIDITYNYDSAYSTYYYDWNTTLYLDGIHNFTVRVYFGSNYKEVVIYVLVDNEESDILIVDDSGSYLDYYKNALSDLGYTIHDDFEIWNESLCTIIDLDYFDIVIWFTGNGTTLNSLETSVLQEYLDRGKSLFISAKHLGLELNGTSFYQYYLQAVWKGKINMTVVNATSTSIYSGSYVLTGTDSANNYIESDYLEPINSTPLLVYNESNISAIAVDAVYRLVYFAFPFESINDTAFRRDIMNTTLNYLNASGKGTPTSIIAERSSTEYLEMATINATIYAGGSPLSNADVDIYIKLPYGWSRIGTAKSNSQGEISFSFNASFKPGTYLVGLVYPGNSTYSKAVEFAYLDIKRKSSELNLISDTALSDSGGYLVFNTTVSGKPYETEVIVSTEGYLFCGMSNSSGLAEVWVSLPPGQYVAKAFSLETEYFASSYIYFTITVHDDDTEPPTITVYYKNASPYYEDLEVRASIQDPSGVYKAVLYYNTTTKTGNISMEFIDGYWVGTIPKEDLVYGSVEWYILAIDADFDWYGDRSEGKTEIYTTEIIDDKAPTISGYSAEPKTAFTGESITIWTVVEEPESASGIASVKLRILKENETVGEYNMSFDGLRYVKSVVIMETGNYTAEIIAKDNAGNEAKTSFKFSVIGKTMPKIQPPSYIFTYVIPGIIIATIASILLYLIKTERIKIRREKSQ